jgi:Helix-turn-helix domain
MPTPTAPEGSATSGNAPFDSRVARALTHPLRMRILTAMDGDMASPRQLAAEFREPLGKVSYHVRTLAKLGCIELVKTEPRRGALEHYYRAIMRPVFSDSDWAQLPASLRQSTADAILSDVARDVSNAARSGGFLRDNMHLSRTPIVVDAEGWTKLSDLLEQTVKDALAIQAESTDRLAAAGQTDSQAARVILMLFEPSRERAQGDRDDAALLRD